MSQPMKTIIYVTLPPRSNCYP